MAKGHMRLGKLTVSRTNNALHRVWTFNTKIYIQRLINYCVTSRRQRFIPAIKLCLFFTDTHLQQFIPWDFVISVQVIQTERDWNINRNVMHTHTHRWWKPVDVEDACPSLTQQFVCPAVERLAGGGVLVLLIVLNRPEVSQGPHEAPEVHLVLSEVKTVSCVHIANTQR